MTNPGPTRSTGSDAGAPTLGSSWLFGKSWWVRASRSGLRLGIGLGVWFVVFLLDPLDLYSFTAAKGANVVTVATSAFYGWAKPRAQNRIVVVQVTQTSADYYNRGKNPLPIAAYNLIFQAILGNRPKVLFIDVGFDHYHAGEADLFTRMLQGASEFDPPHPPVPVLFGMGQAGEGPATIAIAEPLRRWVDPRPVVTGLDKDATTYPLQPQRNGMFYDSAALALYRIACEQPTCSKVRPKRFRNEMALQWGLHPPDDNIRVPRDPGCTPFGSHLWARLKASFRYTIPLVLPGRFAPRVEVCPYTATLDAAELYQDPDKAQRLIQGRVVLFALDDGTDLITSPVNGRINAVFEHAMALDNLITYGANYYAVPRDVVLLGVRFQSVRIWSFLIWLAIGLLFELFRWRGGRRPDWYPDVWWLGGERDRPKIRSLPHWIGTSSVLLAVRAARPIMISGLLVLICTLLNCYCIRVRLNNFLILIPLFLIYNTLQKDFEKDIKEAVRGGHAGKTTT